MIHGVGVDIVQTARVSRAFQRWTAIRFMQRIFTEPEILDAKRRPAESLHLFVSGR